MPFKIYRSSAGSGKTFTLVKEYLRLALATDRPDLYRGILAITFTNKAAEEMKGRVIEVLGKLASDEPEEHPMAAVLVEELKVSREVLRKRAQLTVRHMLHHYSDISISTIDHFTHRVIRTFAIDLGLSINFEVELDTDRIKEEIVQQLMQLVGTDRMLTDALVDVVQTRTDDEKAWSIRDLLKDFSNTLFNEETRFHLNQLHSVSLQQFNGLRKTLRAQLSDREAEMRRIGTLALNEIRANGLDADRFFQGAKGIHGFFLALSKGERKEPNSYVKTTLEQDKWASGKATESDRAAIGGLKQTLTKCATDAVTLGADLDYLEVVFKHLYGIALLDEMQRIQSDFQQAEELLHIGEFNHLVSKVVMTETAPFIYERIGHRYRHFLVDEFQDTSVLQWFNLLPLIDESLAHDNLCLVVGDAKQSIYRWRGGDVRQFVELPKVHRTRYLSEELSKQPEVELAVAQRETVLKDRAELHNLTHNYRSSETVVNFNNSLFTSLQALMPEQLRGMYDGNEQIPFSKRQGLVTVKFFQGVPNSEYDAVVLEQLLIWVEQCLEDGFAAGDIAIICRTNREAVKTARFLIENGRQVVSNESLLINSSPKVRLLVNLAAFITEPTDGINLAELVQHLCMVRNETQLTSHRLMELNQRNASRSVLALLGKCYPELNLIDLKQESLFGLFGQLKYTLFKNEEDAYLTFFMDEVLSFGRSKENDTRAFLEYWGEKRGRISIALAENRQAIRLLTIHKSKGLEYPVVIHPFADYPDPRRKNNIWVYMDDDRMKPLDRLRVRASDELRNTPFLPELEEENAVKAMDTMNELYVALTRAKERLYVSGKLKSSTTKDSTPSTAIQFIHAHLISTRAVISSELIFTAGARVKVEQKQTTDHSFKTVPVGDPFWKERIGISRPSREKWKTADPNDARNLGILIHEAMAHIRTEDDIPAAVALLVEDGRISISVTDQLSQKIRKLIRRTELAALYRPGMRIRNEADIQLSNGNWVRPDRVVHDAQKAWVLDYKTGERLPKHQRQMETYKAAMLELGFAQVEGLLVYLDDELIVSV